MRPKAHQFYGRIIWFSVDQHKIGSYVAVTMIVPLARKRMIKMTIRQKRVVG